jgi:hypothetical protein
MRGTKMNTEAKVLLPVPNSMKFNWYDTLSPPGFH